MAVLRQQDKSVQQQDRKYEKVAELASGGMATVYFGHVRGAGGFERRIAIKEMHAHLARQSEFVRMFFDEARLASRIHHPNVVATLDMVERGGTLALILEYVEGPSLQQITKYLAERGGTMPIDIALRIFLDILAGLHAAHELVDEEGRSLNLVHRDVSPQNMLVSTDGITKITDFGIARAESRLSTTRTGSVKGKVPYMSPEQVKSLPVDRRTDVYAAGVILWEMLTSQRLVQGETDVAMIYQVTDREAPQPREWNPAIPEEVASACLKALEKRAENRFVTAAQFMEALEDAAQASMIMPATPRAVGNYVRGLGLHRPAIEFEAVSRRRTHAELVGDSPESSGSTSMLTAIGVPHGVLESPRRPMVFVGIGAGAVLLLGGIIWLGSPSFTPAPSAATTSPPVVTEAVPAIAPAPVATNPAPVDSSPTTAATAAPEDDLVIEPAASASAAPSAAASEQSPTTKPKPPPTQPIGTAKKKTGKTGYNPRGL
ncbi:MAG: protein kinase [Polyangiaceae bacterium]|nr:protein kinase [Polyangiaceae bacterium]